MRDKLWPFDEFETAILAILILPWAAYLLAIAIGRV